MADDFNIERYALRWLLLQCMKSKTIIKDDAGRKPNTFYDIHRITRKLARKRRNKCLLIALASRYRERLVWMAPRTDGWFSMMETTANKEGWYASFRVSKKKFQFLLDQIKDKITHKSTRDIVIGWPGSVHDARVLSNSYLYRLGNDDKLFDGKQSEDIGGTIVKPVILGDPAYPLLPWLIKPYQHHPDITAVQKNFNYRLSRARMTVEKTFGRWKARCRRFLKKVEMDATKVTVAVAASCILHNVCELSQEKILDEWMEDVHALDTANYENDCAIQDVLVADDASNVRDAIAEYFM